MDLPKCCGKEMKINLELGRFVEVQCSKCNDTVYMKVEGHLKKPVMISD